MPIGKHTLAIMQFATLKPTINSPLNTQRRQPKPTYICHSASGASSTRQYTPTPQQQNASSLEVSATVVENVAFRVTMEDAQAAEAAESRSTLRILIVSESGVCRGPLAAAAFTAAAQERGLNAAVECSAAASRDYNEGGPAEPAAISAAECLGWTIPADYTVDCFLPANDLVRYDLLLVVDKFTAADVLREASVFDTIYLEAGYSGKVRCLGDFHPTFFQNMISASGTTTSSSSSSADRTFEIDDPLYGNIGGIEEIEAVMDAAEDIQLCCDGVAEWLVGLRDARGDDSSTEGGSLRNAVAGWLENAEGIEWMRPPLLSPR